MSFERWIIDLLPHWVVEEGWLPHLALFIGLIAFQMLPIFVAGMCRFALSVAKLLFAALLVILPAAGIGAAGAVAAASAGTVRAVLFLWFIALEAIGGDAGGGDEHDGPSGTNAPRGSRIADACALLGLSEADITPSELKHAYHRAIKRAHPDAGGSTADAIAVQRARDLISEHFGWS